MVQYASQQNQQVCNSFLLKTYWSLFIESNNFKGVMAIFVGAKPELQKRVQQLVGNPQNACFVSCPDVIHAAIYRLLRDSDARRGITEVLDPCTTNSS